eukprot:NODE_256_length_11672_cov_0.220168.p1 type:complete len:1180 gc:universal NODE_256_length_11672_cov_0.220168:4713-1174(-)
MDQNTDVTAVRIGSRSKVPAVQEIEINKLCRENRIPMPGLFALRKELDAMKKVADDLVKINTDPEENLFSKFKRFMQNLTNFQEKPFKNNAAFEKWYNDAEDVLGLSDQAFELFELENYQGFDFAKDLYKLNLAQRHELIQDVIEALDDSYKFEIAKISKNYQAKKSELRELQANEKVAFLKRGNVDIIGLTTTGLSSNINIIKAINPKIVFCEEAAECLEGHILVSLQPSVEQIILIGDDQQLTAKINHHDLSKESKHHKFNINLSMFERLAKLNMKMETLDVQRRMRPEISEIPRRLYYPSLKDDYSCLNRENIKGFTKNMIFFNHTWEENKEDEQASKVNQQEAQMTLNIVNYLIDQEYKPSDIVVLTPYLGQMLHLKKIFSQKYIVVIEEADMDELIKEGENSEIEPVVEKQSLSSIRISTVDNFQGEESKIIVISTVRNLPSQTIGFLDIDNRINVMLSRARDGMIVLGNIELLKKCQPKWQEIENSFSKNGRISENLEIICQAHGNIQYLTSPQEFETLTPEGGCSKLCDNRMECGHSCKFQCHVKDHRLLECREDCLKKLKCGHFCKKMCKSECDPCIEPLKNYTLPCNHVIKSIECGKILTFQCQEIVENVELSCGHFTAKMCIEKIEDIQCNEPCHSTLECGHECTGLYHVCENKTHPNCSKICNAVVNGHTCKLQCHSKDEPHGKCTNKCPASCKHSKCKNNCADSCLVCLEKCQDFCEHVDECPLPCGAPCIIVPCDKRCSKLLICGHQCPSVCGETCPPQDYCRECSDRYMDELDTITLETYGELNLDKTPIIVLPCQHFFSIESLDGLLGFENHFSENQVVSLELNQIIAFPKCPNCKSQITNISRYSRMWKKAILDHSTGRFRVEYQNKISKLQELVINGVGKLKKKQTVLKKAKAHYTSNMQNISKIKDDLEANDPNKRIIDASERFLQLKGIETDIYKYVPFRDYKMILALNELQMQIIINVYDYLNKEYSKIAQQDEKLECQTYLEELFEKSLEIAKDCNDIAQNAKLTFKEIDCKLFYLRTLVYYLNVLQNCKNDIDNDCEFALNNANQIEFQIYELMNQGKDCSTSIGLLKEYKTQIQAIKDGQPMKVMEMVLKVLEREGNRPLIWYSCPNGHRYTIGECGMAMETSRCPDCNAVIGGGAHTSAAGNTQLGQSGQVLRMQ